MARRASKAPTTRSRTAGTRRLRCGTGGSSRSSSPRRGPGTPRPPDARARRIDGLTHLARPAILRSSPQQPPQGAGDTRDDQPHRSQVRELPGLHRHHPLRDRSPHQREDHRSAGHERGDRPGVEARSGPRRVLRPHREQPLAAVAHQPGRAGAHRSPATDEAGMEGRRPDVRPRNGAALLLRLQLLTTPPTQPSRPLLQPAGACAFVKSCQVILTNLIFINFWYST